jgi:hypothetical protein
LDLVLDELRAYYDRVGICAVDFRCPMAGSCRAVCGDFVSAREAFVGSEYETGTLPRVLFVSLDPARSDRDPSKRTMQAMRRREESASKPPEGTKGFRRGAHWYETHKFAHDLLGRFAASQNMPPPSFEDVHRYFAHTNSAKCKDLALGTEQGHQRLFHNCRQFVTEEVATMRPDIIVTQGVRARESLSGAFTVLDKQLAPVDSRYGYEIVKITDRPVLKLGMYHPNSRGHYKKEVREAWDWYMQVGHAFLTQGK